MPRKVASLDEIVRAAISPVAARLSKLIARSVASTVEAEVDAELKKAAPRAGGRRRSARGEMTKWVADRRARRVPNFVIEMTGMKTKKQVVEKFGANATFEKGKALPPAKAGGIAASATKVAKIVKAKGPIIRKGAAKKVA
jgi:hypothetical protein